ncbi:ABC transporter ATP-binding protein [Salipaludibacillus sp. LMS25]|jgi:nickel transport system ATP-binding protein|uniref:ABC transporter ATP-binding protein n=1 Tax=Salipaludibacillus sp. LMS25 TaxID=2924031 RepID=UPI0020D18C7F|nr:ABC transporter ATP-binding protein [Salipaludibacillus sp. LMS25]UTR13579.1 ABC transporter ATP-binding protein [Salipaludibacillus sp. LMS25]
MSDLLRVDDLTITTKKEPRSPIIQHISFTVKENACLGIVGESGSGKSMTCKAILGLLDNAFHVKGDIRFNGENIVTMTKHQIRKIRGKDMSLILQNPMTAFNPLYTIGSHIFETLREHLAITKQEATSMAIRTLEKMMLSDPHELLKKYPHQLSGGMLQRVMIGIAIALEPKIIIADEPTTALDSVTQFDVINELRSVREKCETSLIIISHDLGVISKLADDVLVLKDGQTVEYGELKDVFTAPKHPHTQYLVNTKQALMTTYYKALQGIPAKENNLNVTGS